MPTPKNALADSRISVLQYTTMFVCFLMNILDGMDVLVISYCAPAIAKAWGIGPEALGVVFGAALAGMTLGTLLLAPLADHIGRKKMILISTLIMGSSMFATSFCEDISQLIALRFISGIGIGCMLASTTALIAEYAPETSKDFWVNAALSGYAFGAVLSGLVAAQVIPSSGWQAMFKIAGLASLITLPAILFGLAESIDFYLEKQPANTLTKVNAILVKMNKPTLRELPPKKPKLAAIPVGNLLKNEYRMPTFQLWLALFLAFGSLYFLTSWIPKLAESTGLPMSLAIYAGTVFNVGAFFGVITQGYFSNKNGLKKTIGTLFILTAFLMAIFKFFIGSNVLLLVVFGLLGFGIQGSFVGLYALAARLYPTEFRTTGIGWSIGIGRFGGVFGPMIGGVLVGMGLSMATNFLIFAIPTLLAGIVTLSMSSNKIS